jgi:hypothetical protein
LVTIYTILLEVVERDGQRVDVVAAVVGELDLNTRETLVGRATQSAPSARPLHVDKSR